MSASPVPRCALLAALAVLATSTPGAAQAKAAAQTGPAASRPSHAAQLKSALRFVAAAQARHHAAKSSYTTSVGALRAPLAPGVRVEIMAAGPKGWQARAQHQEQPGRSCVIFVGRLDGSEAPRTDADREMAGEEGVPLCDRMR